MFDLSILNSLCLDELFRIRQHLDTIFSQQKQKVNSNHSILARERQRECPYCHIQETIKTDILR